MDNGCPAEEALALDSIPLKDPCARVVHEAVNRGYGHGQQRGTAAHAW